MMLAIKLRKLAAELIKVADTLQKATSTETVGAATYNRASSMLFVGRKKIQLTRSQTKILTALLDHRGEVLSREELTCLLFGEDAINITSRTIDTHISTLRGMGLTAIATQHGRGYMLP
jgi:DNA-binding response OmpR family regulator